MDEIVDDCTCGVCLDLFTDPRILPCGHTYCQKCVECLLEGARHKSAQCPECRAEFRQPAMGFPVNYGMLGMATCQENSATTAKTQFLLCGTCVAKMHKGHDYQELEVSKTRIEEALEDVLDCHEAYCENVTSMHREMAGIEAAIERFGNLIEDRGASLAAIVDDLNCGNEFTEPQLKDKLKEYEEIKYELEKCIFLTVFATVEECNRRLCDVLGLEAFADAEGRIKPRVVELPVTDGILGFGVRGGKNQNSPIYISEIVPGGAADRNGELRRGDQLIKVNEINVEDVCQDGFMRIVKNAMTAKIDLKLTVRYSPELLMRIHDEKLSIFE